MDLKSPRRGLLTIALERYQKAGMAGETNRYHRLTNLSGRSSPSGITASLPNAPHRRFRLRNLGDAANHDLQSLRRPLPAPARRRCGVFIQRWAAAAFIFANQEMTSYRARQISDSPERTAGALEGRSR